MVSFHEALMKEITVAQGFSQFLIKIKYRLFRGSRFCPQPVDLRSWESQQTLMTSFTGQCRYVKQFQNLKFTIRR